MLKHQDKVSKFQKFQSLLFNLIIKIKGLHYPTNSSGSKSGQVVFYINIKRKKSSNIINIYTYK